MNDALDIFSDHLGSVKRYHIEGNENEKLSLIKYHVYQTLKKLSGILKLDGLDDTDITERITILSLLCNGYVIITDKQDGVLRSYTGQLGGMLNNNFEYTSAFPVAPGWTSELKIDEDCIVVYADPLRMGFFDLINRYAELLTENEISILLSTINSRRQLVISTNDANTIETAKQYLKDLVNGKLNNVIGSTLNNAFSETNIFDGPNNAGNNIIQLIELEQYLKASRDMELGLDANFNMKREAINDAEAGLNEDTILPAIDVFIKSVKDGFDKVNKKYNKNIKVELASAWGRREKINNIEIDQFFDNSTNENGGGVDENTSGDISELETAE